MSIEFNCPKCNQFYSVPDDMAGCKAQCEQCGTRFILPASGGGKRTDPTARTDHPAHRDTSDTSDGSDTPDSSIVTLKSSPAHAAPPAIAPTLDADIERSGMTISRFMAKHGIEGGVRLAGDEGRVSGVEGGVDGVGGPGTTSRASDVLTDEQGRKYQVGKVVAKGGMGAIVSAKDLNIRRTVAMKVMLQPEKVTEQQVLRFIEEAQVTGQLEHPNIVPVHELGVDAGENVFYTMKFVQGANLKDILAGIAEGKSDVIEAYPLSRLLTVFQKVCDALAFAHAKGVIHRDLKPENIMVGDYGEVLVMDWGLAKIVGRVSGVEGKEVSGVRCQPEALSPPNGVSGKADGHGAKGDAEGKGVSGKGHGAEPSDAAVAAGDLATGLGGRGGAAQSPGQTRGGPGGGAPAIESARADAAAAGDTEGLRTLDGQVMGTPAYMAPEQALGKISELEARTDVYSLGAIFYSILTLRPPVEGKTLNQVLIKVARGEIVPPTALNPSTTTAAKAGKQTGRAGVAEFAQQAADASRKAREQGAGARPAFPHCPGGRIPAPLSAVVMKALALAPEDRYPSVKDLQVDIERYQAGFATVAEHAGLARQLLLLARRHKAFVTSAALVFLAVTFGLIVALVQRQAALAAKRDAQEQRDAALVAKRDAQEQRDAALVAKRDAQEQRDAAEVARADAEYASYRAMIGLAATALEKGDAKHARELLDGCPKRYRHWEWGHLTRRCRAIEAASWPAPGMGGVRLVMAPDGRRLGLARTDGFTVAVSDISRGNTVPRQIACSAYASVAFVPGTQDVLVAPVANELRRYDLTHGERVVWRQPLLEGCLFAGVVVPASGQFAVVCVGRKTGGKGEVSVRSLETGAALARWDAPATTENLIACSPDGRLAAVGQRNDCVLLSLPDAAPQRTLKGHHGWISGLCFSSDGKGLVTASGDRTVRVWNVDSGECRLVLSGHAGGVMAVAMTPDSRYILSSSTDRVSRVWDATSGVLVAAVQGDATTGLAVTPDGGSIFMSYVSGMVRRMDLQALLTGETSGGRRLKCAAGAVWDLLLLPPAPGAAGSSGCAELLVSMHQSCVRIDTAGRVLKAYNERTCANSIAVCPARRWFATRKRGDCWPPPCPQPCVWNLDTGELVREFPPETAHDVTMCFADQGRFLLVGPCFAQGPSPVKVYDTQSGDLVRTLDTGLPRVRALLETPDHAAIVIYGPGNSPVQLWDIKTGERRPPLSCTAQAKGFGEAAALSPDGRFVAAGVGTEIWVFDLVGNTSRILRGHTAGLIRITFSPDGRRLASGDSAGAVIVWDATTGLPLLTFTDHDWYVRGLVFTPDGRQLVSGAHGLIVRDADPWE